MVEAFYDLKSRRENTQILRRRADVARQRLDTVEELFENAMGNLNFDDIRRQRVAVNFAEQSYFCRALGLHPRGGRVAANTRPRTQQRVLQLKITNYELGRGNS